jgi:hypothetical protein
MSDNNNTIGLNDLVDYKKKEYSPFMDRIMRFLWKCGGADAKILEYSPYSDHIKSAGIGGVVLATSVMATLAMGFAMHTIFASPDPSGKIDPITNQVVLNGNWLITIPIATVWGLIIFNLDRFIVSTVKGDGTEKITVGEWGAMLPRLVMAVLIGLTISAPLETYIFKREIQREWEHVSNKMAIARTYEIEQQEAVKNEEINNKIIKNDSLLSQAKKRFDQLTTEVNTIQTTVCTAGENCPVHGEIYKSRNKAELTMAETKRANDSLNNILGLNQKIKDSIKNFEIVQIKAMSPGFLDQLMMLEGLSAHGKEVPKYDPKNKEIMMKTNLKTGKQEPDNEEIYGSAFWPIWLVRLLFMIIEIAPVIFKFMIWKSSYDYMQDNVAQILEAKQGISLELIIDENNSLHKIKENYNARRIVEVSKRQNELEKENAIHAITLYAEKEREEIDKDPSKFVKSQDEPEINNNA